MRIFTFAALFSLLVALAPTISWAKTVEYNLSISQQQITIAGKTHTKIAVNGTLPGPTLNFVQGDDAIVHVTNTLAEATSVHWHGVLVPQNMDGAPGFNHFAPIEPGQTFTYRFPIRQSGTYWYHAHSLGQEQDGLYGSIVIAPKLADGAPADADYVVMLSEYTPEDAQDILNHLKMSSDYYQFQRRTVADFIADIHRDGWEKALKTFSSWGKMRMLPTDLSDVSGYHFLINGKDDQHPWTGIFKPGQKVRLRFINAGTMTLFDVRIPGLKMVVVAADGQPVEPVTIDEFRLGNAETYDVIIQPTEDKAYTIAAESLDREGFAIGTLAPRPGMSGPIPAQRPRTLLTMSDMNMEQMMQDDPDMDMSVEAGWPKSGAPAGTKVLKYSDLVYQGIQSDTRAPTRSITMRLDGSMNRYIWTMNGQTFDPAVMVQLAYNERVRITYINDSMMAHPIHLHGMFAQLDNGQAPQKMPNKHTIIVAPGQSVSVLISATEPGYWPFHCHLLYHMAAGMMTTLNVSEPNAAPIPMTSHMDHDHGGEIYHAMRLETDATRTQGKSVGSWDLDGWVGTDLNKFWLKSQGESRGSQIESAQIWALYSRNVDNFWDAQIGVRQDINPFASTYLTLGTIGLAPYFFDTEAHVFIRDDGVFSARLRQENDVLLTNRLILKPYAEANFNTRNDPAHRLGTGLTDIQLGLQMRYEITRSFAPYVELKYMQLLGKTATFAQQHDEQADSTTFNMGVRWLL